MLNKLNSLRTASVSEEGFTLIELIIVVVIIGILAAIAIPMFLNQQKGAINAGVKSDVRNANTAIATALVKAPTAGHVAGTVVSGAGGASVSTVKVAADAAAAATATAVDIKISDSATTLTVGAPAATVAAATPGAWDGYAVQGINSETGFKAVFTSTTGKTVNTDS